MCYAYGVTDTDHSTWYEYTPRTPQYVTMSIFTTFIFRSNYLEFSRQFFKHLLFIPRCKKKNTPHV